MSTLQNLYYYDAGDGPKLLQYNGSYLGVLDGGTPTPTYPTTNLLARYDFNDSLADTYGSYNGLQDYSSPAVWTYGNGLRDNAYQSNYTGSEDISKIMLKQTNAAIYGIWNGTGDANAISFWVKVLSAYNPSVSQQLIQFRVGTIKIYVGICGSGEVWSGGANGGIYWLDAIGGFHQYADTQDLRDDTWHHIVINRDSTNTQIYLDTISTLTITNQAYSNASVEFAGELGTGRPLYGSMDLLYFYDKTLDTSEIAELYNSGAGA